MEEINKDLELHELELKVERLEERYKEEKLKNRYLEHALDISYDQHDRQMKSNRELMERIKELSGEIKELNLELFDAENMMLSNNLGEFVHEYKHEQVFRPDMRHVVDEGQIVAINWGDYGMCILITAKGKRLVFLKDMR